MANDQERYKQRLRRQVFEAYGGFKCSHCGFSDPRALVIDHIENNGAAHRKDIKRGGGVGMYVWIRQNEFPSGFQVLCCNCNQIKQHPDFERFGDETDDLTPYRNPGNEEFCRNGHPKIEENLVTSKEGWTRCKVCLRENTRRYRKKLEDDK